MNNNNIYDFSCIAKLTGIRSNKSDGTKNEFDYEKDLWNNNAKKVYDMLKEIENSNK